MELSLSVSGEQNYISHKDIPVGAICRVCSGSLRFVKLTEDEGFCLTTGSKTTFNDYVHHNPNSWEVLDIPHVQGDATISTKKYDDKASKEPSSKW